MATWSTLIFTGWIRRGKPFHGMTRAKMNLVIREAARLEGMVKDMLNFSRSHPFEGFTLQLESARRGVHRGDALHGVQVRDRTEGGTRSFIPGLHAGQGQHQGGDHQSDRILQIFSTLLLLLPLSGCPIMMVPMMKDMRNSGDPKVEAVVQELIKEGVSALSAHRGTNDTVRLDNAKVQGKFIQEGKFRTLLLNALPSAGDWKVVDGESPGQAWGTEGLGDARISTSASLDAELSIRERTCFTSVWRWETLGSHEVLWKANFSRTVPGSPNSHAH